MDLVRTVAEDLLPRVDEIQSTLAEEVVTLVSEIPGWGWVGIVAGAIAFLILVTKLINELF